MNVEAGYCQSVHYLSERTTWWGQMPTVLLVEGYRFFFFSNEGEEPPHIHVREGSGLAKMWLEPLRFAHTEDLNPGELRRIREIAAQHESVFLERWHEHLNR